MKRYLLDTNHFGEAIGRVSIVRDRIQQWHRQGGIFGTCGPVLCELLVGVILRKLGQSPKATGRSPADRPPLADRFGNR